MLRFLILDHPTKFKCLWTVFHLRYMCNDSIVSLVCKRESVRIQTERFRSSKLLCNDSFRCAATFECTDGHLQKLKNIDGLNMCTNIQRVTPEIISLDSPMNEVKENRSICVEFIFISLLFDSRWKSFSIVHGIYLLININVNIKWINKPIIFSTPIFYNLRENLWFVHHHYSFQWQKVKWKH